MNEQHVSRVREALRKFNRDVLNPQGLVNRLIAKTATGGRVAMSQSDTVLALMDLKDMGEVACDAWDLQHHPLKKLRLNLKSKPKESFEIRWESALQTIEPQLTPAEYRVLAPCARTLKDMPEVEMVRLIQGLVKLKHDMRSNPDSFAGQRMFDVSARYLIGSSKLLNILPNKNLKEFGIPIDTLRGATRYVVVAGAQQPRATILIENPHSFEAAVFADQEEEFCWVATYGYGLSKQDDSHGDQLAELISNQRSVVTLARRHTFMPLHDALQVSPLFFWGDLDLAGLDIYRRLKNHLPTIELSALYQPLVDDLKDGQGHTYEGTQKERQRLGTHSFLEIRALENLCHNQGIDQEYYCVTNESLKLASCRLEGISSSAKSDAA